jgi:hypothetical protein
MATLRIRAHGTAAVILGLTALLVIAALCLLWITVEVWSGIILLGTGQPFLGGCMLAIAALNALFGVGLIIRSIR